MRDEVLSFDEVIEEENNTNPNIWGNKGTNLRQLSQDNTRVPPGFILPVYYFHKYKSYDDETQSKFLEALWHNRIKSKLSSLQKINVSVRSSGPVSMPGMMATVLDVPQDEVKILSAVKTVFDSWDSDKAKEYRKIHNIPSSLGTAVIIQEMVYGDADNNSYTGVLFSRDPNTGSPGPYGEFIRKAKGEALVSGEVTPQPLTDLDKDEIQALASLAYDLESDYGYPQDIEFTVQHGILYVLQSRNAKMAVKAKFKVACDLINKEPILEILESVTYADYLRTLNTYVISEVPHDYAGIPASPGAACGYKATTLEQVKSFMAEQRPAIFVAEETSPDDIEAMSLASGIVTMVGGATSHAAIVARSLNKPCIVGLHQDISTVPQELTIDGESGKVYQGCVPIHYGREDENALKLLAMYARTQLSPYTAVALSVDEALAYPTGDVYVYLDEDNVSDVESWNAVMARHTRVVVNACQFDTIWSDPEKELMELTSYVPSNELDLIKHFKSNGYAMMKGVWVKSLHPVKDVNVLPEPNSVVGLLEAGEVLDLTKADGGLKMAATALDNLYKEAGKNPYIICEVINLDDLAKKAFNKGD